MIYINKLTIIDFDRELRFQKAVVSKKFELNIDVYIYIYIIWWCQNISNE